MKAATQQQMMIEPENGKLLKNYLEAIFQLTISAQNNDLSVEHAVDDIVYLGSLEKAVFDFHPLYITPEGYVAGKVNYLNYISELESDMQQQIAENEVHSENVIYVFNGFGAFHSSFSKNSTGHYTAFFEVFAVPNEAINAANGCRVLKLKRYLGNVASLETLDNKVLYEGPISTKTV